MKMSLCRKKYPSHYFCYCLLFSIMPLWLFPEILILDYCEETNKEQEQKEAITNNLHSYKIGDSFFQLPLSDAQGMLSTSTEKIDADVSKLEDSLSELREEMQQLKVALYARFGRSINLET